MEENLLHEKIYELEAENKRLHLEFLCSRPLYSRRELEALTRTLCSLLRSLDGKGLQFPPDIVEWYNKHRAWDQSQGRP